MSNAPKDKNIGTYYRLSESDKAKIPELFEKYEGNLKKITCDLFDDPLEKGNTKRGRAVRAAMAELGLEYKVKVRNRHIVVKPKEKELTDQQKSYIVHHWDVNMTKEKMALLLWPVEAKERAFYETDLFVAMSEFVNKEIDKEEFIDDRIEKYSVPRNINGVINRLTKVIGVKLNSDKLDSRHKVCLEKLLEFMNSKRFIQTIESYESRQDKELFEYEFFKATWEKPDLSGDELNMYINLCIGYVDLRQISQQKQRLARMFDEMEEQTDMSIKLAEMIKTKSDEHDKCAKRVENLITRLNGDRSKRIADQRDKNASIIAVIDAWKEEKERKRMIQMAEMQKKLVWDEAKRLEEMDEWKARIVGISKYEAI